MMEYIRSLNPGLTPSHLNAQNELDILKERILQSFLLVAFVLGILLYILILPVYLKGDRILTVWIFSFALALMTVVSLVRRIPYKIRSAGIIFILYLLALGSLLANGLSGGGPVILTAFIFLTALLLGVRIGIASGVLAILTSLGIGYMMSNNLYMPPPVTLQANSTIFTEWITRTLIIAAVGILFIFALTVLVGGLNRTLTNQKNLSKDLEEQRDTLEEQIGQRTIALEKRAAEMETASQIARDISTIPDLDQLIQNAVQLLKDEFGFYYVAVFLTDDRKEYAVLRSGTGEAGQIMLAQHHRHPLIQTSIVGYSISKKEIRLSQNVSEDTVHYQNPLLPETRSEIALPLIANGEAIGALDVQSTQPHFFQPDDIRVLQVAVDQLAVAFEKARLVEELTHTLEDLKSSYRQITQQTWQNFLKTTRREYAYSLREGMLETGSPASSQATQALLVGETVMATAPAKNGARPKTSIAIPIKLRDQVLGVLDLKFETGQLSHQSIELLESAANRLALALENARLLEEIQIHASRERMVSDISAKVRAESDVERVLQTVAAELGHSLGVSDVLVQLRGPE